MNNHIETVHKIYEAFGRGDIPAILEQLSPAVEWEQWAGNTAQNKGVPWLQARKGIAGAGAFFGLLGAVTVNEFSVLSVMGNENQVAAEIVIDMAMPGSDKGLRDEEIHLWTFNESGKVIRMRHYCDTAKHITAAGL